MKEPLARLTEKTSKLGNYNHKYLHIISTNIDGLTSALERVGLRDGVRLWNYSNDVAREMDMVLKAASSPREAIEFLGCYYSLQFLQMNLRLIDIVKLDLSATSERETISRKFMLEAGGMFRNLTRSYMERLLGIFLEGKPYPEFVMLGVGTRSDQDDIDLGIVVREKENAGNLNRALGQLANQMFRTASRLHFHLSEYVGSQSLTATVDEYVAVLDENEYDFIMVNEIIGAAAILGSESLYREFRERVAGRFYFEPGQKTNRFHEGFLRGILGEIRSVLAAPKSAYSINPKEEGLRPVKGLLSALKLVHGVEKVNAWEILDELKKKDRWRKEQYDSIEKTLSFFELFRHLYQILVAQDEEILIREKPIEEMVTKLARMIGYEDSGVLSAEDFMMVNYYQYLEGAISAIEVLTGDLNIHLREISVLNPIFSDEAKEMPDYAGNLAMDFIREANPSNGITYWDDFLEELDDERKNFYSRFVESFHSLPPKLRNKVGRVYVSGTENDPSPVLKFLTVVGKRREDKKAREIFGLLSELFLDELAGLPNPSDSMALIAVAYPDILNNFLSMLDRESQEKLLEILAEKPTRGGLDPYYHQLVTLATIHHQSSNFLKRHFNPILGKYPAFIRNLHDNEKLREISTGFYSDLTTLPPSDILYERIGDYYDMEFVRVSLMTLSGVGSELTDSEFTEFSDNYTQQLYEFAMHDILASGGHSKSTRDLFALYAVGGHAREQGFDDDYDMIAILDSSDVGVLELCNRVIARMNLHIIRRGIFPHNRMADHFGSYVVSLDQLGQFLGNRMEDVYVDLSQLLGARMLVGTRRLDGKLTERVIEPLIFERDREYIGHLSSEIKARHSPDGRSAPGNIKECPGGQRDIELLLLIYKTRHRVRDPLSRKLLGRLKNIDPRHEKEFLMVAEHLDFIRNVRDLYRLKVAARDELDPLHLMPVSGSLEYGYSAAGAERLYADFIERSERAAAVIEKLVDEVWD